MAKVGSNNPEDSNKKKRNPKIDELRDAFKRAQCIRKDWTTAEDEIFTLEQYAEYFDPVVNYACGNPTIVSRRTDDGELFYKMELPLQDGGIAEYNLAFKNDFTEGDVISLSSLRFCIERKYGKKHAYATGDRL